MDHLTAAANEIREIDARTEEARQRMAADAARREKLVQYIELTQSLYPTPNAGPVVVPAENNTSQILNYANNTMRSIMVDRAASTLKARIIEAAKEIIELKGPTSTRLLMTMLSQRGIMITGVNALNSLSVVLSKSGEFQGDRKVGWSLVRPSEEKAQSGTGIPAGPSGSLDLQPTEP